MNNNVFIKLVSTATYEDDEPETVEFLCEGVLEKRPEGIKISYTEPSGETDGAKDELIITNPEFVTLTRSGEFNSHLLIEKNKRHTCVYETPYGSLMIGVFAQEVSAFFDGASGKIVMSYTVDSNLSVISHNTVTIDVKNI